MATAAIYAGPAILAGGSASVTISGSNFGSSPTVNLPAGFTGSGQTSTGTSITLTISISTSATLGNNSISVTANGLQSNTANLIADYPDEMQVVSETPKLCCNNSGPSEEIQTLYQVRTYAQGYAAKIGLGESIMLSNWTCTNPTPSQFSQTTCADGQTTSSNAEFTDTWTLGSPVNPAGCGFDLTDHWQWCAVTPNKTFATPTGHIGEYSITIEGYTTPSTMPQWLVIKP